MAIYNPSKIPCTVYPKKNAHDFCFAVLCCGYTLTDFPISIRHTSLALWQSNRKTLCYPRNIDNSIHTWVSSPPSANEIPEINNVLVFIRCCKCKYLCRIFQHVLGFYGNVRCVFATSHVSRKTQQGNRFMGFCGTVSSLIDLRYCAIHFGWSNIVPTYLLLVLDIPCIDLAITGD